MTKMPSRSFHSLPTSRINHDTGKTPLSSGDCADFSADSFVRGVDVWRLAAEFPDRWRRFLVEVFGGDSALIQQQFDVSERTVRRWLTGKGGVRAPQHLVAQVVDMDAYRRIVLAEAA